jgi:hypothetical protein
MHCDDQPDVATFLSRTVSPVDSESWGDTDDADLGLEPVPPTQSRSPTASDRDVQGSVLMVTPNENGKIPQAKTPSSSSSSVSSDTTKSTDSSASSLSERPGGVDPNTPTELKVTVHFMVDPKSADCVVNVERREGTQYVVQFVSQHSILDFAAEGNTLTPTGTGTHKTYSHLAAYNSKSSDAQLEVFHPEAAEIPATNYWILHEVSSGMSVVREGCVVSADVFYRDVAQVEQSGCRDAHVFMFQLGTLLLDVIMAMKVPCRNRVARHWRIGGMHLHTSPYAAVYAEVMILMEKKTDDHVACLQAEIRNKLLTGAFTNTPLTADQKDRVAHLRKLFQTILAAAVKPTCAFEVAASPHRSDDGDHVARTPVHTVVGCPRSDPSVPPQLMVEFRKFRQTFMREARVMIDEAVCANMSGLATELRAARENLIVTNTKLARMTQHARAIMAEVQE